MIDLSQVRENILIDRYEEVSKEYEKYSIELKMSINKLIALKTELDNIKEELKRRKLIEDAIHSGSK